MLDESDNETPETVLEQRCMEVYQEADADLTHAEIGEDLGFMSWKKCNRGKSVGAACHQAGRIWSLT